MSELSTIDKVKFEKLFEMDGGYVLDFSNRSFQEFIIDSVRIDIYDEKYNYASGSKANRLRAFWKKETNYLVCNLISDLLEYWKSQKQLNSLEISRAEEELFEECQKIAERLTQGSIVEHIEAIHSHPDDRDFSLLAKSIREGIHRNEPEAELDRLHTYVVKYIRQLCEKHGIDYDKNTPLHSLFGSYVKFLRRNRIIESEMTERILKSSISIMESFNKVRNEQSFAHDNPILNYNESILIFNNVASSIRFIESIEEDKSRSDQGENLALDDIPF